MPKRSDQYMQKRRRQILDAATGCGIRKGWSRVTVDDVATAAHLSKGAVYVHFQSKQALMHGLLERSIDALDVIATCRTLDEFQQRLGAELARFDAPQGRQVAVRQLEMLLESRHDPVLHKALERGTERLIENVCTVVRRLRPELSKAEVTEGALTLIMLLHGTRSLRMQLNTLSGVTVQRAMERQVNVLLQTSAPRPTAARRKRRRARTTPVEGDQTTV